MSTDPEYHLLAPRLENAEPEKAEERERVKEWVRLHGVSPSDVRVPSFAVIEDVPSFADGPTVTFDVYVKRDGKPVWNDDHTGVLITTRKVPLVAPWPLATDVEAS